MRAWAWGLRSTLMMRASSGTVFHEDRLGAHQGRAVDPDVGLAHQAQVVPEGGNLGLGLGVLQLAHRQIDGLVDLLVARAPAVDAAQGIPDLLTRGLGAAAEQALDRQDHGGRAVATLDDTGLEKGRLYRMELFARGERFHRLDGTPLELRRDQETRGDESIVEQNGASAAGAFRVAALAHRMDAELTQQVEGRGAGGDVHADGLAVEGEFDLHG